MSRAKSDQYAIVRAKPDHSVIMIVQQPQPKDTVSAWAKHETQTYDGREY